VPRVYSSPIVFVVNERLPAVWAWLNQEPFLLLIDTGATDIFLLPELIDFLDLPQTQSSIQLRSAQGMSLAPTFRLDSPMVGTCELNNLIAIPDILSKTMDYQLHGILGMSWLRQTSGIHLDWGNHTLQVYLP